MTVEGGGGRTTSSVKEAPPSTEEEEETSSSTSPSNRGLRSMAAMVGGEIAGVDEGKRRT